MHKIQAMIYVKQITLAATHLMIQVGSGCESEAFCIYVSQLSQHND
jgi:hypothetical protein